jgi:hypothetical protein
LLVACCVSLWPAAIVLSDASRVPDLINDQAQVWVAARELAQGHDPYAHIGPGREWPIIFPLYYPLTAPLILWPLKDATPRAAHIVFVMLSAFVLALAVTQDSWLRLPLFLSPAFIACAKVAQWTPLLGAVIWFPWLGFVLAAKPNAAMVVLAASRSWRAAIGAGLGALLLTLISLALWPGWFGTWRATVGSADPAVFVPTVLMPGGLLLLLAMLRWRRWEGRLLLAMALIPQTPGPISVLLLLLIPGTLRGVVVLSLLTAAPFFLVPTSEAFATFAAYVRSVGIVALWSVYLPALFIVLRLPNVGHAPRWIERLVEPLPAWLRGSAKDSSHSPSEPGS